MNCYNWVRRPHHDPTASSLEGVMKIVASPSHWQLTELLEVGFQRAHGGLHRLDLRGRTHAGHRDAGVDRGTHAGIEQRGF